MKRSLVVFSIFLSVILNPLQSALCQPEEHTEKIFKTRYTVLHYVKDKDLSDFIWRLGGKRFDVSEGKAFVSSRVDRIVDRVKAILDMNPEGFNIDVYLRHGILEHGKIALYKYKTKSIDISLENTSDGVFAHEVAHAIINEYFDSPPPSKIQEILTQYVDKHLWSDY